MSTENIEAGAQVSIASKNEKKAIKALKGTGCKKVEGISRVVFRKRMGPSLIITNPEVYRTPNGSYVVIGEPVPQEAPDLSKQVSDLQTEDKSPEAIQADLAASAENPQAQEEEDEDIPDDQVDIGDADPETISMIQEQANVSKAKAVKALKANKGDMVNALMQLTS